MCEVNNPKWLWKDYNDNNTLNLTISMPWKKIDNRRFKIAEIRNLTYSLIFSKLIMTYILQLQLIV